MSERIHKVNSVIAHELTRLITETVDFKPGVFATIAKVDTSMDLRYTRVFVSVFPTKEGQYVMQTLAHERHGLQKALHKKLHIKILPKLSFHDSQIGEHVDDLEKALHDEDF